MNWKQQSITLSVFIAGIIVGSLCNEYTHIEWWADKQLKLTEADFTRSSIAYAETLPTPTATPAPQHNTEVMQILKIVRKKESGNGMAGLAVTCKKLGKSNEYGYNVPHCYNSHEQLTAIVEDWFARKLEKYSLPQVLCLYNSGTASDDCAYYQDYKRYLTH